MHPAGVGRGGIPQQALHSHSKSPSVPRQRSRTTLTPVHQEGFGPGPQHKFNTGPSHLSSRAFRPHQSPWSPPPPGREGSALPPAQPSRGGGAGSPEASWSSFPPPLGGLLQKASLRPEPARPSKLAPGKPGQASLRLGARAWCSRSGTARPEHQRPGRRRGAAAQTKPPTRPPIPSPRASFLPSTPLPPARTPARIGADSCPGGTAEAE